MRREIVIGWIIGMLVLCGQAIGAGERFGRLYDISGDAILQRGGKRDMLSRSRHLLAPVLEGDELSVGSKGRLIVVSTKGKTGYELLPGAGIKIAGGQVHRLSGRVNTIEGLHVAPSEQASPNRPGALIMRGPRQCIKVLAPRDENVISDSVELRWQGKCGRGDRVRVEVREDNEKFTTGKALFSRESTDESILVPPGILKYGMNYLWTVERVGEPTRFTNYFTILEKTKSRELMARIKAYKARDNDLARQLSLVFLLQENGLHGMAEREIEVLKKEHESNQYMDDVLRP